jgi:dolichyl-phosphate-mannose--protein O-mannosyl transferase
MNGRQPLWRFGPLSFPWAIAGIFLVGLLLRFWKLSQFNVFVFDEVYYAKFANDYWLGKPFFPSHPPLSHYLIALGMALGSLFPASPDTVNTLTGSLHSTWSYRWLNALTGSLIPLLVAGMAYQLTQRRRFTLIVMGLAVLDGIYLVESRYALNNIYLVFFGLLGQLFFLYYLNDQKPRNLILAGIFLGCAGSVKWNGFAFLLGLYLLIAIAWIEKGIERYSVKSKQPTTGLLSQLANLKPLPLLLALGILPIIVYSLLWIPHLLMNPDYRSLEGFWRIQKETLVYHERIGNTSKVHPYCSPWYSWLILWRPVAYYYQTKGPQNIVYDVHSMANPILLWFSTAAMIILFGSVLSASATRRGLSQLLPMRGITLYIGSNYLANLLPWLKISRCTFFYHYMAAYLFSWFALALLLENLIANPKPFPRYLGFSFLGLIALGFLYWLPIFLGLPLTPQAFYGRMLLPSWI